MPGNARPDEVVGGGDVPAVLAAEYGYVNGVIPDGEIDQFTDAFSRRIAAFDRVAITA